MATGPDTAPNSPAGGGSRRRARFARRSGPGLGQAPVLLAVPAVLLLLAVHFAAPIAGMWYAFTDWSVTRPAQWVGLENFREALGDADQRAALLRTVELATIYVVVVNVLALALALALNRAIKTKGLLRTLYVLPALLGSLATAYIWQYVFDYRGGLNLALRTVGLDSWQQAWIGDPDWALWAILVAMVWNTVGLTMIIYLAGLQGVDSQLMEAAAVDGAGLWRRFRHIVLALIAPAITINVTLAMIRGLAAFDQVMALTGGGPVRSTETLATQVYKQTFELGRYGYGTALSLIMTLLIAVAAIVQLTVMRSREAQI